MSRSKHLFSKLGFNQLKQKYFTPKDDKKLGKLLTKINEKCSNLLSTNGPILD